MAAGDVSLLSREFECMALEVNSSAKFFIIVNVPVYFTHVQCTFTRTKCSTQICKRIDNNLFFAENIHTFMLSRFSLNNLNFFSIEFRHSSYLLYKVKTSFHYTRILTHLRICQLISALRECIDNN